MSPETVLAWRDRLITFGWLAGTVIAAYLAYRFFRMLSRRPGGGYGFAALAGGVVTVAGIVVTGVLILVFSGPAPANSPWAHLGMERASPVLAGLQSYLADTGRYPESLVVLTPKHLEPGPRVSGAFDNSGRFGTWRYRRVAPGSFELEFTFPGPGRNACRFTSSSREWFCFGYF